jgi:pimeloyl-ACP methyl ester carboxylesterase
MSDLYYETGGGGQPVVLLHPGFADSRIWDPQWQPYAERFRVVRLDLRGFGHSPISGMPIRYALDVAAILDRLAIRDAALVGCSLGGRVALELAVARPDLLRALVLVGAATSEALAAAPEMQAYGTALIDAIASGDLDAAVEVSVHAWVDGPHRTADQVDPEVRARVATMQRDAFVNTRDFAARWSEDPLVGSLEGRLGEIATPTLVLVGQLDMDFFRDQARTLAYRIPQARLAVLEDTAHAPTIERPNDFDRIAVPFLTDPTPA